MMLRICFLLFVLSTPFTAKSDDYLGFYNQGLQFYSGDGVAQDYSRAYGFFDRAAQGGYGPAQYQLGLLYLRGHGIKRDYGRSLHFLNLAAGQNIRGAHHYIGRMHHYGYGVPVNHGQAIHWYSMSIDNGYYESRDPLAELYLHNTDNSADVSKLITSNAEGGDLSSQYNLGYSHYIGHNVEQDYTVSAKWFLKAASQGDKDSQGMLAKQYANGQGVDQSNYRCYLWAALAADSGDEDTQSLRDACADDLSDDERSKAAEELALMRDKFQQAF